MKKLFLFLIFILAVSACTSSPTLEPNVETPPVETPEASALTKELLVSGDWGPEETLGAYIEFHEDGTYIDSFAGEGDGPQEGTYEITGDEVALTRNEGGSWSLTLGEADDTLHYTRYLAIKDNPSYWDRSAPVPAGSERTVDTYPVIIVDSDAQLKPEATPKSKPSADAPVYEFRFCGGGCEEGDVESFAGSFTRVLARTETKEEVNGVEDYWYLVGVELNWYSGALIDGEPVDSFKISYAWMHGSELQ